MDQRVAHQDKTLSNNANLQTKSHPKSWYYESMSYAKNDQNLFTSSSICMHSRKQNQMNTDHYKHIAKISPVR